MTNFDKFEGLREGNNNDDINLTQKFESLDQTTPQPILDSVQN